MFEMQGGDNWRKTRRSVTSRCDARESARCEREILAGHTHYVEKGTSKRRCWICYEEAICAGRIER